MPNYLSFCRLFSDRWRLSMLFQPFEWLIILGAAFGSYMIGNSPYIIKSTIAAICKIRRKYPYNKEDYTNLLLFMYSFFKFANSNGAMELENQIDNAKDSIIFNQFPDLVKN